MKRIIRTLVILVLLAAAGFGVAVLIQKSKDKKDKVTEEVPVVIQDSSTSQPIQTPPLSGGTDTLSVPPSGSAPTPSPVAQPPAPISINPPPAPVPSERTTKVFKSATGLTVTMPTSWQPQEEVRDGKTYTVFYDAKNIVVASIEAFANSSDTLAVIEQQLQSSPSVKSVKSITVASTPALQFESAQETMLVIVKNKTTYYISGELAKDYSKLSF